MKKHLIIFIFLFLYTLSIKSQNLALLSPSNKNLITFSFGVDGELYYSVAHNNQLIITPSILGYELNHKIKLDRNFELLKIKRDSANDKWKTIWGQQENVTNNYNEIVINLRQKQSGLLLNVIARAFDDGVAFRYEIPKQKKLSSFIISNEFTRFCFAKDYKAWWGYADYDNYEKSYYNSPVSEIGDSKKYAKRRDKEEIDNMSNTPMTLEINDDLAVTIHEAELIDYPDMSLERLGNTSILKAHLTPWMNGDLVRVQSSMKSPWRTFQIGTPGEIALSNMLMNLNAPCKLKDTKWIETFKYVGIWWEMHIGKSSWAEKTQFGVPINKTHGANTENAKKYIDFASENGFKEVLVEGWDKGWDNMTGSWTGYGIFDWKTPTEDYDIKQVCQYAKEKGVRIMMYFETISDIDHFEPSMDKLFSMCNQLGIKTIKVGYTGDVNYDYKTKKYREHHHGQYMVRHYNKMVRTAAKYKLMVINHEPIKYTGEQRTYPNLMAREGAKGQEYNAWSEGNAPEHTVVLPFTRLVSGPMDYTPGIFKMNVRSKKTSYRDCSVKSTICKELALLLTMYSPIEMAADLPENYEGVSAFQFLKDVPTSWSQSKVLNAKIGDFYTVARKEKGTENWYIGSITDENPRNLEIYLGFLLPNKKYECIAYCDGKNAHWKNNPTDVEIKKTIVKKDDKIKIILAPGGGQAIQIKCVN